MRPSMHHALARGLGISSLGLSVLLLSAQPSAAEERTVARTGAFAEPVSTPRCSDLADGITKYAGRIGDYTADWVSDSVVGLGKLATGSIRPTGR